MPTTFKARIFWFGDQASSIGESKSLATVRGVSCGALPTLVSGFDLTFRTAVELRARTTDRALSCLPLPQPYRQKHGLVVPAWIQDRTIVERVAIQLSGLELDKLLQKHSAWTLLVPASHNMTRVVTGGTTQLSKILLLFRGSRKPYLRVCNLAVKYSLHRPWTSGWVQVSAP